jgi:metal dependent phosphohydrolase
MKKTVYILIGVAGVGKSTYTEKHSTSNSIILSSDSIREELFGTLAMQDKASHTKVFDVMNRRLKDALTDKQSTEIFYDATNLKRNRRSHLYRTIKSINKEADVVCLVFSKPLEKIIEQNNQREGLKRVPEAEIRRMYKSLEVPKIGVDCDRMELATSVDISDFESEFAGDTTHDSNYHKETVREHINMTIKNAKQTKDEVLIKIARFHDLGKFICKQYIEEKGIARFIDHEKVSAMYYFVAIQNDFSEENLLILEVIFQHMQCHSGFSDKYINKHKLTERELSVLSAFAKIDDISRIV